LSLQLLNYFGPYYVFRFTVGIVNPARSWWIIEVEARRKLRCGGFLGVYERLTGSAIFEFNLRAGANPPLYREEAIEGNVTQATNGELTPLYGLETYAGEYSSQESRPESPALGKERLVEPRVHIYIVMLFRLGGLEQNQPGNEPTH
jgi:hypothetical protein